MMRTTGWSVVCVLLASCAPPAAPWTMDGWTLGVGASYPGDGTVFVSVAVEVEQPYCPLASPTLKATLGSDLELIPVNRGGMDPMGFCNGITFSASVPLRNFTRPEHNTITISDGPWSGSMTIPTLHQERRLHQEPLDLQPDGTLNVVLRNDATLVFVWSEPSDTQLFLVGPLSVVMEDGTSMVPIQDTLERGIQVALPTGLLGAQVLGMPSGVGVPVSECHGLGACFAQVFAHAHAQRVFIRRQ